MQPQSPAAFISYSREDSVFAMRLAQDLKAAGASVWLDQLDIPPGAPWDDAVEAALASAPQMLLVLSPASVSSRNVRNEIAYAEQEGKTIVPVLHLDCKVPLQLLRNQRIDFRGDYHEALEKLVHYLAGHSALPSTAGGETAHTIIPKALPTPPSPAPSPPGRISGKQTAILVLACIFLVGGAVWLMRAHEKAASSRFSPSQQQSSSESSPSSSSPSTATSSPVPGTSSKKNLPETSLPTAAPSPSPKGKTADNTSAQPQEGAGALQCSLEATLTGRHGNIQSVAFSPNGRMLAVGNTEWNLDLWDVARRVPVRHLVGHQDLVDAVAFAPNGHILASAARNDSAVLWNADSGEVLHVLRYDGTGSAPITGGYGFFALDFSSDGHTLATGNHDGARLWDVGTGKMKFLLKSENTQMEEVAFSPDGRSVASAGGKKIWLWDATTGKLLRTLQDAKAEVTSLAFSPDGKMLASGDKATTIDLWSVPDGALVGTLDETSPGAVSLALASNHSINSLAFSPTGRTLLASDNKLRFWDMSHRSLMRSSVDSSASFPYINLSADGRTLAAYGDMYDNKIKIWKLSNVP